MSIAIERDRHGQVSYQNTAGKLSFKIPKNMSILNVLHGNIFEEGDCADEEGYIYNNGVRKRKWFQSIGSQSLRVWAPKLDNLPLIEEKFWKVRQQVRHENERLWNELFDNIGKIEFFRGEFQDSRQIIFDCRNKSIGWHDARPEEQEEVIPIRQDLVDHYFRWEKRTSELNNRHWQFKYILGKVLNRHYSQYFQDNPHIKFIKSIINGREYLLEKDIHSRLFVEVAILGFPDDIHVDVV